MTKAVIFDLDGVIVNTDTLHFEAWKKIADKENIYFDEKINHKLRGVSRMESLDIILENSDRVYTHDEKIELATIKNDFYKLSLSTLTRKDILPGIAQTLNVLKELDIKIAIGSSSKNAKQILKQINLYDMFDAIADGNDIINSKPAPDVFLVAAKKLQIDPVHCVVVEDAIAGIEAAKKAKMTAVAVSDAKSSLIADYKLDEILEILSIL